MPEQPATEVNDVTGSFEILIESIESYEESLMERISELARERNINGIKEVSNQAEQIRDFKKKVNELKTEWTGLIYGEENEETDNGNRSDISATARTSWQITNDGKIRVETERVEGPSYSNVFPVNLFKDIALCAVKIIEKQGFVKTTDVLTIMAKQIIDQSDYKKSPRLPVYATFKVLMKQNLFKNPEDNSHKYIFATGKSSIMNWVNSLR